MISFLCILKSQDYLQESHPYKGKLRRAFERLARSSFKSTAVVGTQDSKFVSLLAEQGLTILQERIDEDK